MKRLIRWWREHLTRRELLLLSDYQLRDVGLTRAQVDAMFR